MKLNGNDLKKMFHTYIEEYMENGHFQAELKKVFKESIQELISEGKLKSNQFTHQNTNNSAQKESEPNVTNEKLNQAVKLTTHFVSRGDKNAALLYEHIIADTAKNTLQKQLAAGLSGGSLGAEIESTEEEKNYDHAQLNAFSAKDRWADLAFGNTRTNK